MNTTAPFNIQNIFSTQFTTHKVKCVLSYRCYKVATWEFLSLMMKVLLKAIEHKFLSSIQYKGSFPSYNLNSLRQGKIQYCPMAIIILNASRHIMTLLVSSCCILLSSFLLDSFSVCIYLQTIKLNALKKKKTKNEMQIKLKIIKKI